MLDMKDFAKRHASFPSYNKVENYEIDGTYELRVLWVGSVPYTILP
jgi:hypothetical protein